MDNIDNERDIKVKKAYNQLKSLKRKELTPSQENSLMEEAQDLVDAREQMKGIEIEAYFTSAPEKRRAKDLLKKYLSDYTIETVSDRNTLSQLIYLEILNLRLQDTINKAQEDVKAIPSHLVKLIHENLTKIAETKESLGISKKDSKQEKQDGFAYLQLLKRKYSKWLELNQLSRTFSCPYCGKHTLLKIKTDVWEAQKHPFIKDRILTNEHLIKLYKEKIITKEDLANIFEVSPSYIDWLCDKIEKTSKITDNETLSEKNESLSEETKNIPNITELTPNITEDTSDKIENINPTEIPTDVNKEDKLPDNN